MTTQSNTKQTKIERALKILALSVFTACLVLTFLAECERANWTFYLVAQFRLQLLALSMLTAAAFGVMEYPKKLVIALCICAVLNGRQIIPLYFPSENNLTSNSPTVKIVQINLNYNNKSVEKVGAYIRATNPDVIFFSEVTPAWHKELKALLVLYPHEICISRNDPYGIGVYSKRPITNQKVEYFGPSGHPSILGSINNLHTPVAFVHTHITGPVKDEYFEWHKEHFEKMENNVRLLPKPLILSGDTNSNTWSYLLSDFLTNTSLKDSRSGRGVQLSWPVPFYFSIIPTSMLCIDHYFVSPEIVVVNRKIGEDIGSDHFPVYMEFGLQSRTVSPKRQ